MSLLSKLLSFSILVFFSSVVALRGQTRDSQRYFDVFLNVNDYNLLKIQDFYNDTGLEIGFGWYSYLISLFSDSSFLLFFPIAFFIFYLIYKLSIRCNSGLYSTLLVYLSSGYFAIWQFIQIRQGISLIIALYAVKFLLKEDKNVFLFLFLGFISLTFHQSSIFVLFLGTVTIFFLNRNKLTLRKFKVLILIMLVLFIFLSKFVLLDFLIRYSPRVGEYVNSEFSESEGIFRLPNIKAILLFILFLSFFSIEHYKNRILTLFLIFFSLNLAFRIGFSDFGILSGRISSMFGFVEIFLFPVIIRRYGISGKGMLLLYIILQFFITYTFQVPDLIDTYFIPLEQ